MIESPTAGDIPIACALNEPALAAGLAALEQEVFAAVDEHQELADGYAFRFPDDDDWLPRLAAFVVEERRCCPFFQFELIQEPGAGPIWLRLRGPGGAKEFIEAQFLPALPARKTNGP